MQKFFRFFGRGADALAFWSLVPSGGIAVVSGYLSTSVGWISQFGAFGWFSVGLFAFLASSASFALIAKTKLWRLQAKERARIMGDSNPFDPMARVYENKRLYLRDLAPVGRKKVIDKRFIGCEIIGPGTAVIGLRSHNDKPFPQMKNCNTFDVDVVQINPACNSFLAVDFVDCDFDGCNFYHMTLLFTGRENQNLNWITPDFNQLQLQDLTNDPAK